jgi:hypothetical protein
MQQIIVLAIVGSIVLNATFCNSIKHLFKCWADVFNCPTSSISDRYVQV